MCFNRQPYILILRAWKKEGNSTSLGLWKCFTFHQTTAYAVKWSEECSDFYMGETKQPLRKHTAQHRRALRSLPRHFSSRSHLASGDWIGPVLGWGEVSVVSPSTPGDGKALHLFSHQGLCDDSLINSEATTLRTNSKWDNLHYRWNTWDSPTFLLELKLGLEVKCFHQPEVVAFFFSKLSRIYGKHRHVNVITLLQPLLTHDMVSGQVWRR